MPLAAAFAAPWVSSERWAEASKPVIVYWVSRKPNGMITNQKAMRAGATRPTYPELLNRSVKT